MDPVLTKIMGDSMTTGGEASKKVGGNQSNFKEMLETQMKESDESFKKVEQSLGLRSEGVTFQSLPADQLSLDANSLTQPHGGALQILNEMNRSALQLDDMIEMATSTHDLSARDLLAIQAGVMQCSHEITMVAQITASLDRTKNTLFGINFS